MITGSGVVARDDGVSVPVEEDARRSRCPPFGGSDFDRSGAETKGKSCSSMRVIAAR